MQTKLMPDVPIPATQPWLWKWDTIFPLAKRAGEIITIERGGDRRVLALANPGLGGLPYTSSTLWGAIQYLGPGEAAPAHRHTPSAIRFVMVGSGVYTTVNGDACDMEPGDLVLTPYWNWHDHNHHGSEPMVWFDGLDLPLVATLESIFFENHRDQVQEVLGRNLSEELYTGRPRRPVPARARGALAAPALPVVGDGQGAREAAACARRAMATLEYRNPVTGGPVVLTFTCEMSRLFPGARTPSVRRTGSTVYVVLHGRGRSVVDGLRLDWGPGDIFVAPSWAPVDHEADEPADLFAISDRPVLQSFRLYKEEALAEPQAVSEVFTPR